MRLVPKERDLPQIRAGVSTAPQALRTIFCQVRHRSLKRSLVIAMGTQRNAAVNLREFNGFFHSWLKKAPYVRAQTLHAGVLGSVPGIAWLILALGVLEKNF